MSNSTQRRCQSDRRTDFGGSKFIQKQPDAKYTFDSERGAPQSEICREEGPQGRECMMVCFLAQIGLII